MKLKITLCVQIYFMILLFKALSFIEEIEGLIYMFEIEQLLQIESEIVYNCTQLK